MPAEYTLTPRLTLVIGQQPPSIQLLRDCARYEAVAVSETTKKVYHLENMEPEMRAPLEYVCVERRVARAGLGRVRTGIAGEPEWAAAVQEWKAADAAWRADNERHKEGFFEPPEAYEKGRAPTSCTLMYLTLISRAEVKALLMEEVLDDDGRVVLRLRTELERVSDVHGIEKVPHTRVAYVRMAFAPLGL